MLLNQLNKVITRTKKGGFREGFRYIRGQIYSTSEHYILRNSMNNIPEITSDKFVEFQITEVVDPDSYLFHEIYRLWPLDIKPSSTEFETELLKNRSKTGAMCFAMLHNNKLIGANWLYPPNQYYLSFSIPFLPGEYVSTGTFIVPGYRGMGASKFLKISGLNIAKQKGILSVISMSSVKNVPSVKMNLATGFKIIGSVIQKHRLFKYSHSFIPESNCKE